MDKATVEGRIGALLKSKDFAWAFKPPDVRLWGGQVRIDWLACDMSGKFWMVEVKQVAVTRRSFNLDNASFISPGQKDALTAVAQASTSVVLLAVWQKNRLYVFNWRRLWQCAQVKLDSADFTLNFGRKKQWEEIPFRQYVSHLDVHPRAIQQIRKKLEKPSPKPEKSPSISKRTASTRTARTPVSKRSGKDTVIPSTKVESEPSSLERAKEISYSALSRIGGRKSSKTRTP